jgi:pimeloyl-ACP methyl ester carboxylesterase
MDEKVFVYLHGFASSSNAYKGTVLREAFAAHGYRLHTPDLNCPSFEHMTYSAILAELNRLHRSQPGPWFMIGSSMGGYLAARWAELYPTKVARMVLLCPAFDLPGRWENDHGSQLMENWKKNGHVPIPDVSGEAKKLSWEFIEDARKHPTHPSTAAPTLIIHGTQDDVVPVESSRAYVRKHAAISLVEVDDDHGLALSIQRIQSEVFSFFGLNTSHSE